MSSKYSWDNIAQDKTLSNVVRDAPYNIAQDKNLCNVVRDASDNIV